MLTIRGGSPRYVVIAALLLASPAAAAAQHPVITEGEVLRVARSFREALASGDSAAVLALLHDDAIIFETGRGETKQQYRRGHLRADIAYATSVRSELVRDDVMLSGDVAIYTREYRSRGRFRDRDVDSVAAETMVLVRTEQGWKIRHIHWSSGRAGAAPGAAV
jgi:ketosteroid isomerase-like protein